jgi:hypothetical protein
VAPACGQEDGVPGRLLHRRRDVLGRHA